jgi:DNA-directed RNA polymerase III subunit RPC3
VELRNVALVKVASEKIGETTASVYAVLLRLLSISIPRCKLDPVLDDPNIVSGSLAGQQPVTTKAIYNALSQSIDVSDGIGKVTDKDIHVPTAERIHRYPRNYYSNEALVDGKASSDEDEEIDEDEIYDSEADDYKRAGGGLNGNREPKVTFADASPAPTSESRQQQMRKHLLLLCDSKLEFVRHSGRGLWTVDFGPLLRNIQEMELDKVIERKVGRLGLRIARVLKQKGKVDEKTLPNLVFLKKTDVQNKLLELQVNGFADIQEVPRDSNRVASRTMFFWYCDVDRCLAQLLDNNYKAILRCLQTREVHRSLNKDVLAFVERPDVKGREKEALEGKYFTKYEQYRDVENKLLGQVLRIDNLVAILRDF